MRALIASAAVMILALTACSSPVAPGPTEPEAAGGALAACAMGSSWVGDIPDLASQLLEQLRDTGATSATGTGGQRLDWNADGTATISTDYILTVVVPMDEGLVMTMKQTHSGDVSGTLTLDGDVATGQFSDGYVVQTLVDINGQQADAGAFPLPSNDLGTPVTMTCDADHLTTRAQGSFATEKWDRFQG